MPNRLGLAAMFLLITAAAGCTNQAPHATAPSPGASGHASATAGTSASASGPATFPGPDGTEARWVVQENERPGTTAWKIGGRAAGISGFAGQVYAEAGQQVTLYASTTAPWFRAQAFRMGYYQGRGGRLIWTSIGAFFSDMTYYTAPITGAATGAGVLDTGTNNWIPALGDRAGCHPGGICESAMVQRITANILRLFGQGPAARHHPSIPNWRQLTTQ